MMKQNRRLICFSMRIGIFVLLITALFLGIWGEQIMSGESLLIFLEDEGIVLPLLLALMLDLLRQRQKENVKFRELYISQFDNTIWWLKMGTLCIGVLSWGINGFTAWLSQNSWSRDFWFLWAGVPVSNQVFSWLGLIYAVELLYRCWPEMVSEWTGRGTLLRKLLMSLKIMAFDCISRAKTVLGKIYVGVAFVLGVILLAVSYADQIVTADTLFLGPHTIWSLVVSVETYYIVSIPMMLVWYLVLEKDE